MIRVLLADDNPVVRQGLASLLTVEEDITVVAQAVDGADAVERAARTGPDIALLDVRMPGTDGVAAAAALRGRLPVLMLTYSDDETSVTAALRAGATGYLVHGQFTPDELVAAVRSVAGGGAAVGGTAAAVVVDLVRQGQTAAAEPAGCEELTPREREVLRLVAEGRTNRQVSRALFCSEKTVKNHLTRVYAKLGTDNRSQAIARWLGAPGLDVVPEGSHGMGTP